MEAEREEDAAFEDVRDMDAVSERVSVGDAVSDAVSDRRTDGRGRWEEGG